MFLGWLSERVPRILKFLVAFGARPRPIYGRMNLEGTAVAVVERPGTGIPILAGVDRGSCRTAEDEDNVVSQARTFRPRIRSQLISETL